MGSRGKYSMDLPTILLWGVTLNNGAENSLNVYYDPNLKTIMNEDGLFALNSIKGFKWVSEIKFLKAEPGTPWKRYQWDVSRALTSFDTTLMRASIDDDYESNYDDTNYDAEY